MFSSNQKIEISCEERQLKDVVAFFFKMYEYKPTIITYQPLVNGRIAIGYDYGNDMNKLQEGWQHFIVERPSLNLITATISDWVNHVFNPGDGYLLRTINSLSYEEKDEIKNWSRTLFIVDSYNLFYHK